MKYIKTYEVLNGITFQQWLKKYPQDINTTEIDCSDSSLIDLNGIKEFKNLKALYCHNNKLTELPYLPNSLKFLYCFNNKLTELPDLPNNLEILDCYNNNLTELPDLFNILDILEILDCGNNQLPYNNLEEYIEWHKKEYPWKWDSKKYNL